MRTTAPARRRTALGAALTLAALGLVVPTMSADATPPGEPLDTGCSSPAPTFLRGDHSVDGSAVSATAGDFNADGHPDIAAMTSGLGDYYAVVLRGDGQGGFGGKTYHEVTQNPAMVAAADWGGDGYDDLAVSHNNLGVGSAFEVGTNTRTNSFGWSGLGGNGTWDLVPGDFDDDGKLDVAASANGGLEVYPGLGDGGFGAVRSYPTVDGFSLGIAAGDFNGDGRLDAVTAAPDANSVSVLLQTDTGFASPTTVPVANRPIAVAVGDFDEDGNPDIAVARPFASVEILLGDGDGGFVAAAPPALGYADDIVSGDFNHDGTVDLALLHGSDASVSVATGIGDGSFRSPTRFYVGRDPVTIAVADVNEDGLDDLVSANFYDANVSVLVNTSRPTNDAPTAEPDSYDVPADGVLDVPAPGVLVNDDDINCDPLTPAVVAGPSHGVLDLDPNGSFTYTPTAGYVGADSFTYRADDGLGGKSEPTTVSLNVSTVRAVDDVTTAAESGAPLAIDVLANDSDTSGGGLSITAVTQPAYGSVAITGGGSGLSYTPPTGAVGPDPFTYTATGPAGRTGTATVTVTLTPARGCVAAELAAPRTAGQLETNAFLVGSGDFDGNGSVDLANYLWDFLEFEIAYNDGSGDFPNTPLIPSSTFPDVPSFVDMNSDGRLDAVFTDGASRVNFTFGAAGGLNGPVLSVMFEFPPEAIAIGDVDEDGAVDVVVSDGYRSYQRARVEVLKGDGVGGFEKQPEFALPGTTYITLADMDGDGHLDLVGSDEEGADGGNKVWVKRGDGQAGFGPASFADVGDRPAAPVVADYDGDGFLDVATLNYRSDDVSVLYGDGSGGFAPAIRLRIGPSAGVGRALYVADLNADGRPDLVATQETPRTVHAFLSRGAGGFAPGQLVGIGPGGLTGIATGDFNSDGSVDVAFADDNGVLKVLDNQCATRIRPTAVDNTYVTSEDSELDVHRPGLIGNDTYGGTVTVSVPDGDEPSHGDVDVDPEGSFTYTPDEDFFGRDSFTYKVDDGHGGTDTATVNITVKGSQDGPDAVDDTATVPQDADATTLDVLDNDIDPDSDELTVTEVTGADHGTVAITNDGADLSYKPAAGYFGADSFAYTISDGHGGTDSATVDVVVARPNTAPVANDDTVTVAQESSATTVDVLGDDTDAESDALEVTAVTQGGHGTVLITNDGADVSYEPATGYFGTDSFTYTISDGFGGTDTATVDVTVTRANTAPVANDDELTVAQDAAATTVDVLVDDTDVEDDALTVTGVTQGAHGTVVITNAGADLTYQPAAGYFGTDSFTYTISDGFGGTDTATVDVTVTRANTSPVANDDELTVAQDSSATTVDVLVDDTDAEDDSLTVTAVTQGGHGTVVITNDGADVSYQPAAGYFGPDSFAYTVSDGFGGTDTATVAVTVTRANTAPVAADDDAAVQQDSDPITIDVLDNDTDVDNDTLTVTIVTQGQHGTVAITNDGANVSYKPATGFHGADSFTYTISDGFGGTDTATVEVTVTQAPPPNTAPVATDDNLSVAQDSVATTVNVLANDDDADDDPLTVTGITQGEHGTVAITTAGADLSYKPATGFHGADSFTYTISDGRGGTDTATVTVTVTQAPSSSELTVLSYDVGSSNVLPGHRWVQRRNAVADLVEGSDAQVIGLQGTPHRERVGRRTAYPIADLRTRLPEFSVVGDDARLRIPNLLLYRTSEFAALDSGTARLAVGVRGTRGCRTVSPSSATWALLKDRVSQQTYFVVDANLSRGFWCSRQREVETQKLMTLVRNANDTNAPVVLLGSLNAGRFESSPRLIDRGLDPTVPLSQATPTLNTFWDARWANDTRRLDYVFHSAELTVSRPGVIRELYVLGGVRTSPSSHYAVRATLRVR